VLPRTGPGNLSVMQGRRPCRQQSSADDPVPPSGVGYTRPNHNDREPRGPIGANFLYCVKATYTRIRVLTSGPTATTGPKPSSACRCPADSASAKLIGKSRRESDNRGQIMERTACSNALTCTRARRLARSPSAAMTASSRGTSSATCSATPCMSSRKRCQIRRPKL